MANAVASPPAADEAEQLNSRLETFDSTRLLIAMIRDATDEVEDDTHVYDSVTARVAKALATWVKVSLLPLAVVLASDLALLLA